MYCAKVSEIATLFDDDVSAALHIISCHVMSRVFWCASSTVTLKATASLIHHKLINYSHRYNSAEAHQSEQVWSARSSGHL